MFETTVVRTRAADRRLLPISIVVHATIVAAVVAASLTSTRLPQDAPKQMLRVFYPAAPPELGAQSSSQPRSVAAPPRAPASQATLPVLHTNVPPALIPVNLPTLTSDAGSGTRDEGGREGVPNGTPGGTGSGNGGTEAPDAAGPLVAGAGGAGSPVVLHRVEPLFPPFALRAHMGGTVVLQCIIDKTGHVRDVRVVRSSFGAFEQPAIDAVEQWLFAPGRLNGQPVDVLFQLTVNFQVR
ncbi:MAG TPA: energy transducer TonB [Thermoanaerobaculia bacterium]|nr:energy transducer TonB [Thermoanaerobaculia bacterium]